MPFLSFCTEIVSRHVGKWLIQKVFSGSAYYTRLGKFDPCNPINLPIRLNFLSFSYPFANFSPSSRYLAMSAGLASLLAIFWAISVIAAFRSNRSNF